MPRQLFLEQANGMPSSLYLA